MTKYEKMRAYVTLAFRVAFPHARRGRIVAALLKLTEVWVVVVEDNIYSMTIGSDDEEFSFICETDPSKPRVKFAFPPNT